MESDQLESTGLKDVVQGCGMATAEVSVSKIADFGNPCRTLPSGEKGMSDAVWERLRPHLPGGEGKQGRPARDSQRFIDAVCWILRTGSPWRDLPPDYGYWKNTHRRFCRWRALRPAQEGSMGGTVGGGDG